MLAQGSRFSGYRQTPFQLKRVVKETGKKETLSTEEYLHSLASFCKLPAPVYFGFMSRRTERMPATLMRLSEKKPEALSAHSQDIIAPDIQLNFSEFVLKSDLNEGSKKELWRAMEPILSVITESEAKKNIAHAILNGKFGDPMDRDTGLEVLKRLDFFEDKECRPYITLAILGGKFGDLTTSDMIEEGVPNLAFFIGQTAQLKMVKRLYYGEFGLALDPNVALRFAQNFSMLNISDDISIVRKSIFLGRFGNPLPSEVAKVIAAHDYNSLEGTFKSDMLGAMANGIFGSPMPDEIVENILQNLAKYSEPLMIKKIEKAVVNGVFGKPLKKEQALQIIECLFHHDARTMQQLIGNAVFQGFFGEPMDKEVSLALVQRLQFFTDAKAQKYVASAIREGKFGAPMDKEVGVALIQNMLFFAEDMARDSFLRAIHLGRVGSLTDQDIAEGIVQQFRTSSITPGPSTRTQYISGWIRGMSHDHFDAIGSVLTHSKEFKHNKLTPHSFPFVEQYITLENQLNCYQRVQLFSELFPKFKVQEPLRLLPSRFMYLRSQYDAILKEAPKDIASIFPGFGRLMDDAKRFVELVDRVESSSDALQFLRNELQDFNYQEYGDPIALTRMIADQEAYLGRLSSDIQNELGRHLGGEGRPLGVETVAMSSQITDFLSTQAGMDVSECFENKEYTYLFYGKRDTESEYPKLLLTYNVRTEFDRQEFQGWLSPLYPGLFHHVVGKVKVYDLSGTHPMLLDIQTSDHDLFHELPIFMRKGILDHHFDIKMYMHSQELNLIFGKDGLLSLLRATHQSDVDKLALINKMESIIKMCIVQQGGAVMLSSDPFQDKSIKDAINALCPIEGKDPFILKVSEFLASKSEATCARLAFLFGQLAKRGVLGYEFRGQNQANELFYVLSSECFKRLTSQTLEEDALQKVLEKLEQGVCIELITHGFLSRYRACGQIWQPLG